MVSRGEEWGMGPSFVKHCGVVSRAHVHGHATMLLFRMAPKTS